MNGWFEAMGRPQVEVGPHHGGLDGMLDENEMQQLDQANARDGQRLFLEGMVGGGGPDGALRPAARPAAQPTTSSRRHGSAFAAAPAPPGTRCVATLSMLGGITRSALLQSPLSLPWLVGPSSAPLRAAGSP